MVAYLRVRRPEVPYYILLRIRSKGRSSVSSTDLLMTMVLMLWFDNEY